MTHRIIERLSFGNLIQIFANLGVIAGILFLAIEIRQNNEQLQIQSYQAWATSSLELNMAVLDPSLAAVFDIGIADSRNLTNGSYISYALWHESFFQMAQTTDYLYRAGTLDHELWKSEIDRAAGILAIPSVRQWWDAGAKSQFTPQFVEMIESIESDITVWGWAPDRGFVPRSELSGERRSDER